MRDVTISDIERLEAQADEGEVAFEMDEDAFRAFYDRTARPLWVYLSRIAGDRQAADDLLQETYYRFLRARVPHESESHRRHYLFRIATNLVHDRHRRRIASPDSRIHDTDCALLPSGENVAQRAEDRTDLQRAFGRLKPRERELLWLAYAQGSSHREIGEMLGVKAGSIKLLLFRARRKLAGLLRATVPAERLRREN